VSPRRRRPWCMNINVSSYTAILSAFHASSGDCFGFGAAVRRLRSGSAFAGSDSAFSWGTASSATSARSSAICFARKSYVDWSTASNGACYGEESVQRCRHLAQ
jgi:hypothetical protein